MTDFWLFLYYVGIVGTGIFFADMATMVVKGGISYWLNNRAKKNYIKYIKEAQEQALKTATPGIPLGAFADTSGGNNGPLSN